MSEEILEQTAEELEEEQQAVAESLGGEILDETKTDVKEDEEEEEVEEAVSVPKTKAGMIKALYDQLNNMKKSDLSDSFSKIMGSTLTEEEEDYDEDEEEPYKTSRLEFGTGMAFFLTESISLEPSVNYALNTYNQEQEVYIGETGYPYYNSIYDDQERKISTNAFYFKIAASMYF